MTEPIKLMLDSIIISMATNPSTAYGFLSFCLLSLAVNTTLVFADKRLRMIGGLSLVVIFAFSRMLVEAI